MEKAYNEDPTLGYRRMEAIVGKGLNESVNKKMMRRLMVMGRMDIKEIFLRKSVAKSVKVGIRDLVKRKEVMKPNQAWTTNVT